MARTMRPIPAGMMLTVGVGLPIDHYTFGVYRATQDIDPAAILKQWLALHPGQSSDGMFDNMAFLDWLISLRLLEEVPSFDWHLSDYSTASEMAVYGPGDDDAFDDPFEPGDDRDLTMPSLEPSSILP